MTTLRVLLAIILIPVVLLFGRVWFDTPSKIDPFCQSKSGNVFADLDRERCP